MKITNLFGREILDSKGNPTVEAEVTLENGIKALGGVPSGASTGATEAFEMRDNDPSRYLGKGVLKAIANINGPIKQALVGQDAYDQQKIDEILIALDGTENKSKLGGNALTGVSMAICRAAARSQKLPLYQYFGQLSQNSRFVLPQPLVLILEGGKHGNWATDCQEFFVIPKKEAFPNFRDRLRAGAEIFRSMEKILNDKGYAVGVGFEGAYMPKEMKTNEEAFELMIQASEKAGYKMDEQILLGVDAAASEFSEAGKYELKSEDNLTLTKEEWLEKIVDWSERYPLWSLEDMFEQEDWESWTKLTARIGNRCQIVGDDLLTTNAQRIQKAIDLKACNSVLIKVNQIGTITETIKAIKLADSAGFTSVISHRGGETNDDLIADLCVGTGSWQSKFGGPDRGERVAKYNRLLRIGESLAKKK
ncbi:MAG: Enolase [Microgenomates group bacterium ADurb.Bin219]|nr:MAG: Enolase [Microgenomates group bacterium ADurb.Bin219]HNP89475.1 phosphopyruvate hydratase [Candidatus Woesebacteria bacterium]